MISALAPNPRANLSLTRNLDVLDLYTDRLGRIRTEEKAATEWTFRSMEIQFGREVVKVFCRCVFTASAQDVPF
jgi:hypothetical protein